MKQRTAIVRPMLAVFIASLAACLTCVPAGFILTISISAGTGEILSSEFYSASLAVAAVAGFIAGPMSLALFCTVGLPLWQLSLRLGRTSIVDYVAVGFAVSTMAAGVLALLRAFAPDSWFTAPLMMAGGTFATLAFWLILRPDRQKMSRVPS